MSGPEVVKRVAQQTSVNPQVLLAFLEFRSGWVRGQPADPAQTLYPIGFYVPEYQGLYLELSLVAKQLNMGYYGWREGTLTDLTFPNYTHVRISPGLNAGSVALQTLTSKFYRQQQDWLDALYGPPRFSGAIYRDVRRPLAGSCPRGATFPARPGTTPAGITLFTWRAMEPDRWPTYCLDHGHPAWWVGFCPHHR